MSETVFQQWERKFSRDAKADGMEYFRNYLRRLNLPDEPKTLLNGTIMVMQACCAYLHIDNRQLHEFLETQPYLPDESNSSHYAFTFNLHDKAYARILTPLTLKHLDLADLFNHPWNNFRLCGYSGLYVSHTDDSPLTKKEIEDIESAISADLRFDFTEDEVGFWSDPDTNEGILYVCVYDVDEGFTATN